MEALYLQFCSGNENAQREFYQRINGRIYNHLRRTNYAVGNNTFTNEDVENSVLETWHKLWILCTLHKTRGEAFMNYVLKVARNLYFDAIRKPENKLPTDSIDDEAEIIDVSSNNPEKIILSRQQNEFYVKTLKKLPKEQLEAYLLKAAGYSVQEIAEITGANIEAVRSRIRMAKEKLRRMLNNFRDK